jgi:ABC-type polysaccharide/polyol phosphate transport system, ATPase component
MSDPVIILDKVNKGFPLYHSVTSGIKRFLFNLPQGIKSLRNNYFEALRDISFEINRGETFGIIGRNGSGKSTILGLIAGVLKPTSGCVTVKGRVSPLLELGAGFHPELSGRENILLNGILMGLTRTDVMSKINDIIEFSELGEFIDQPIRVYSSGMLARLGFSVVSSLDPEILLVDEILAVGDFAFQKKCMDRMVNYKKNGVTIVFVSHAMGDVKNICDRVVWIDNHMVKMIDGSHAVVQSYLA